MIIDTSALLAILFDEPDGPALLRRIAEAPIRLMSSANAVEAWIVADRHANPAKGPALDALLETLGIDIVPVTVQHRNGIGTKTIHWRVGTQGITRSTRWAAVWAMRWPA